MKKFTKKSLLWRVPVMLLAFIVASAGGYYVYRQFVPPTEIRYSRADYAGNPYNLRERAAIFTYVFVAYVEETYDMHTTKLYRKFPASQLEETANTECTLKVIRNIKGELRTDAPVTYYKPLGANETLAYLIFDKDDVIPEKGKTYLFLGFVAEDNTIGGGGPNSTVELEEGITIENLDESKVYQRFIDACENPERNSTMQGLYENLPRYMSEFDVNFKKITGQLLPDSPSIEKYESWQAENAAGITYPMPEPPAPTTTAPE